MTFKVKPKQLFSAQQLLEINSSATNLANSAMFECGVLALGGDRWVGQEEGALLPHMKQMLRVLPLKFIMEMIAEQEKKSGKESNTEENDKQ